MSNKKQFSVEHFELIEDKNSHFIVLDMKIASSGMNKHNLPITDEALEKSAKTIFGKPVLAYYDEHTNDFKGHESEELPVGVVLDKDVHIKNEDGKSWLYAKAYLWKKYFPELASVFKKKNNSTDISMEIEVEESEVSGGYEWIKAFNFLGVTLIGVEPAIAGANATVLQFSEISDKAKSTFSERYDEVDFIIPNSIKESAKEGLSLYNKNKSGATPVALATARFLIRNESVSPEKVRQIQKYFLKNKTKNVENKQSDEWISLCLWGGEEAMEWSSLIVQKMNDLDNKQISTFEKRDIENVSLKTIETSKDELNEEEKLKKQKADKTNSFSEDVENDKEKEEMSADTAPEENKDAEKEEMSVETSEESEEKKEEMTAEAQPEDEEKTETEDKPSEEESEDGDVSMSNDAFADVAALMAMLDVETEQSKEVASLFECKDKNYSDIAMSLFSVMKTVAKKYSTVKEENASLIEFKSTSEKNIFSKRVEDFMNEVKDIAEKETLEDIRKDSENYNFSTVEDWETKSKAILFSVLKNGGTGKKKSDVIVIPNAFENTTTKKNNKVW